MLTLLVSAATCALLLVVGLVLAVVYYLEPRGSDGAEPEPSRTTRPAGAQSGTVVGAATSDPRDRIADEPMLKVDDDASHPGAVSTRDPGAPILVPSTTLAGPAGVPTGFPHTAAGALMQLAAIDQMAMQSLSLDTARQVIEAWASNGGPTSETWSVISALAQILGHLGVSGGGAHQVALVLTPVMGLIKGTVGPDFVLPCIDFELDLTLTQTARGAIADCQRMVWQPDPAMHSGGRWLIGPGAEPTTPPSIWPDTDLAFAAGYRDLRAEG